MTSGNRSMLVLHLMIKCATLETLREPAGFFFRILMLRCKLFFYSFKIETCIMKLYRPISMDQ